MDTVLEYPFRGRRELLSSRTGDPLSEVIFVARYSPHAQPVPSFAAAAAKLAIAASFYHKRINYN
jgi:hypothetical protein